MWRQPEHRQRNRKIFDDELDDFLPPKILDFHIHVVNEGVYPTGKPQPCAGHPIAKYDFDDLRLDLAHALPRRDVYGVCFGSPHPQFDWQRNNRYLAEHSDHDHFFPLRVFHPGIDTPEQLRPDIDAGRFCGLKPYPDFVDTDDADQVEIHQMLPDWCMDIADSLGLIIMLHIPRRDRLADPVNQQQIVELARQYPNAKIILAHIGRAYFLKCVVGHLDRLKDLPNVYVDLAMLNHPEVLQYTFQHVPPAQILFGTDIPIALAPGKSVEINDQYTYVTPVPWKLSISDDHGKIKFASFLNEQLRAIKKAVQGADLGPDFVEQIFFSNGMKLLGRL